MSALKETPEDVDLSTEEIQISALMQVVTTEHRSIEASVDRVAEAVREQTKVLSKPTFWFKAGELLLKGAGSFCGSVGGHRAAAIVVVLLFLMPLVWMMAGTGMQIKLGDYLLVGPVPISTPQEEAPDVKPINQLRSPGNE